VGAESGAGGVAGCALLVGLGGVVVVVLVSFVGFFELQILFM
jgi:hypothetical protein